LGVGGSEIFPKQTELSADRDDLGNWMVRPYFGQTYDDKLREQVGLRKTGTELTLGQFLDAAEAARVEPSSLERWARQKAKKASPASRAGPGPSDEPFADGPPCLQAMVREGGVPSGGQNNALLNMGTYYKKADPNGWKERLHKANNEFLDPPGSFDGLQSTINSLDKKDYNYTCRQEPLAGRCNSALCRQRRFGVGDNGNQSNLPIITKLIKLETKPPL
jgi:hypothetical protein